MLNAGCWLLDHSAKRTGRLLFAKRLVPGDSVESMLRESWELTRMISASINTVRTRRG